MKKFTLIIGIDISKASLHVSYQHREGKAYSLQLDNQAAAIEAFLRQMLALEPDPARVLICCEHTGTYGSRLALAAKGAGLTLWMVHPLIMRHASADLGRYKTDKADAAKIRSFAHTHQARATDFHHPSAAAHQLRQLQQARKQLVGLRQQLKNMITDNQDKAQPLSLVGAVLAEVKAHLTQAIRQVEQEVGRLIASDASLRRMHAVLLSIPGIGPVTSTHLLALTDRFTRFPGPKALACFVGTAPFPNQSGYQQEPQGPRQQEGLPAPEGRAPPGCPEREPEGALLPRLLPAPQGAEAPPPGHHQPHHQPDDQPGFHPDQERPALRQKNFPVQQKIPGVFVGVVIVIAMTAGGEGSAPIGRYIKLFS
jgi:transposase